MTDGAPPLPAGTVVAGRFRVVEPLGEGATGRVYSVQHERLAHALAMKVLHGRLSTAPDIVARFEREAQVIAKLDHPGIVRVTDFGESEHGIYMITERVDGAPLSSAHAPTVTEALTLMAEVLDALAHAHARGVVHRDLKPDNVLVDHRGHPKLLDFGLARLLAPQGPNLTQQGAVMGTPKYMSPEQASGEPVGEATDLYAVGVMLYELVEGKSPFEANTAVEVLTKHITQPPPPLVRHPELQPLLDRALAKAPEDRFRSAEEFAGALRQLGGDRTTGAPREGDPEAAVSARDGRPMTSTPTPWGRIAVFTLLALAMIGTFVILALDDGPAATARELLADGRLDEASAVATRAVQDGIEVPSCRVVLGHVALARDDAEEALGHYEAAIEADPTVVDEDGFATHLFLLLDKSPRRGAKLVRTLTKVVPDEGAPVLTRLATEADRPSLRRAAYEALERLGQTDRLDTVPYLIGELARARKQDCYRRKWYVTRLIETSSEQIVEPLRAELNRKDDLLGLVPQSGCMSREIRAALRRIETP